MFAIPALTRGGVHPRTMQSYEALRKPDKSKSMFFMPIDRPTTGSRSDTLRIAKEFGVQSVMFIDSDMEFEPDAYERLCRVKADIACGLFWNRQAPSYPTICVKEKTEDGKDRLRTIVPDGKVQDVDVCGMAFTLIRKPVLDAFEYPAFQHTGWMSEDFVFCLKAREKGFSIRCDTGLKIAHRGDVGFNGQPELVHRDSSRVSFPFGITRERESWKSV